jgi:hypothetical protein
MQQCNMASVWFWSLFQTDFFSFENMTYNRIAIFNSNQIILYILSLKSCWKSIVKETRSICNSETDISYNVDAGSVNSVSEDTVG